MMSKRHISLYFTIFGLFGKTKNALIIGLEICHYTKLLGDYDYLLFNVIIVIFIIIVLSIFFVTKYTVYAISNSSFRVMSQETGPQQHTRLLDETGAPKYGTSTPAPERADGAVQLGTFRDETKSSSEFMPIAMAYQGQDVETNAVDVGLAVNTDDNEEDDQTDERARIVGSPRLLVDSDSVKFSRSGSATVRERRASFVAPVIAESGETRRSHGSNDESTDGDSDRTKGFLSMTWSERRRYLSYYFPVTVWLPKYNPREQLAADLLAGLSVGAMLVPQSIAYASLVGLSPLYGLGTAFLAMLVYFIFGSSPILSVGPEATTSILVGQLVLSQPEVIAASHLSPEDFVKACSEAAATLSFLTGILTLLFGLFRLGFVDTVFSRPVLSGFIFAVGGLLILDQSPKLLGVAPCTGEHCETTIEKFEYLWDRIVNHGDVNWRTIVLSILCISFLFAFAYIKRRYPKNTALQLTPQIFILVVVVTLISYLADLGSYGVAILGDQEGGFPKPHPPFKSTDRLSKFLSTAITVTVLGFVETQLVNKTVPVVKKKQKNPTVAHTSDANASNSSSTSLLSAASQPTAPATSSTAASSPNDEDDGLEITKEIPATISPNRELIALGVCHIIASCFGCYAAYGSLTRTKVSTAAGAGSQVTNLVSAFIALFTMLFMMPLFKPMPTMVTGAIIFFVGTTLLETHELIFTFKLRQWMDFGLNVAMIFITFIFGVDTGLFFAFAACLLLVVKQQNKPAVRLMGRLAPSHQNPSSSGKAKTRRSRVHASGHDGDEEGSSINETYFEVEENENMHDVAMEGLLIYQIDGPLFFSNAEGLKERTRRIEYFGSVASHPSEPLRPLELRGIIFDIAAVTAIDASAASVLLEIIDAYKKRGVSVVFVKLRYSLRPTFERAGIISAIGGPHRLFRTMDQAVAALQDAAKADPSSTSLGTSVSSSLLANNDYINSDTATSTTV